MSTTPFVDSHLHVYPFEMWGRRRTSDHVITEYGAGDPPARSIEPGDLDFAERAMGRAGIGMALAINLYEPARLASDLTTLLRLDDPPNITTPGEYLAWLNAWLCSAAARRTWLRPVVAADPIAMPAGRLLGHLESCVAAGARGVKLHHAFAGLAPDDGLWDPLYRWSVEHDVPIVSHSGTDVPLAALEGPLDRFPGLPLVVAHLGGAGWRDVPRFARRHPMVVFDVAEILWWLGAPGAPDEHELTDLIEEVGPDRVLFGSDFPWYEPGVGLARLRGLALSQDALAAITGGTAVRRFRLGPAPAVSP